MEVEEICKVCNSHDHSTGNCPPTPTYEEAPVETLVETPKSADFAQILENLQFTSDPQNDEKFCRESAKTTFEYNGVSVELEAVFEHHLPLEHVDTTFVLKYKGKRMLIADIFSLPDDQQWSPITNEKTSVTLTSIQRLGKKRSFPQKLRGIGVAFYEGLLHYNQILAERLQEDLIHRIRPTPLAGEGTDWNLKNQENWDGKFNPLLEKQGYVKRKIAIVPSPINSKSRITVYEEEMLPRTTVYKRDEVYEKKYSYKPEVSQELE